MGSEVEKEVIDVLNTEVSEFTAWFETEAQKAADVNKDAPRSAAAPAKSKKDESLLKAQMLGLHQGYRV